jgi:hypothetical protein
MDARQIQFSPKESSKRIDAMLNRDMLFEETGKLVKHEELDVNKGLYLDCSVLCIRVKRPKRSYVKHHNKIFAFVFSTLITELVNLFETNPLFYDIKVDHNCIWGIFKSDSAPSVNMILKMGIQTRSLINMINVKLEGKMRLSLEYTLGLDIGTAILMRSDLLARVDTDKVWTGDPFDAAYKLAGFFDDSFATFPIRLSGGVYQLLNAENQGICKWHDRKKLYHCNELYIPLKSSFELNYYAS